VSLHQTIDAQLPSGTRFGSYEIVRAIGAGGMGAVYEAVHTGLKKRVALKTLHAAVSGNEEVMARFLREGEAASRIRHPNVVDVTDLGVQDGTPFLVMEYLEGESLSRLIIREAPLSVERTLALLLPVISAVSTAHDEGVIHRDLKPENIFLAKTRLGQIEPKLLDFGISKVASTADLTKTASFLGTPQYISPEQAQGSKHVDGRADQYALGVILMKCTTGVLPATSDNLLALLHKVALGQLTRPREVMPELSEAFEAILLRAMALEPAGRFPHVAALGEALLPLADGPTQAALRPFFQARVAELPGTHVPVASPAPRELNRELNREHDTASPFSSLSEASPLAVQRGRTSRMVLGVGAILVLLAAGLVWFSMTREPEVRTFALPPPSAAAAPEQAAPAPAAALSPPPPAVAPTPSPTAAASKGPAPSAKPADKAKPAAPKPKKGYHTGTNDAPIVD